MDPVCAPTGPGACATNMANIHLLAGDLAGAYRELLPLAEAGDPTAIQAIIEVCVRAGDTQRAQRWQAQMPQI